MDPGYLCLDRWTSLLLILTTPQSPGSSDGMMPKFLVEEGGMEKLVIVAISLYLFFIDGPETRDGFVYTNDVDTWHFLF